MEQWVYDFSTTASIFRQSCFLPHPPTPPPPCAETTDTDRASPGKAWCVDTLPNQACCHLTRLLQHFPVNDAPG